MEAHQSIDILINNAGVFKTPDITTQDGLDVRFVVNTFAPYIIANTLLPILSEEGRIINLSSAAQAPISLVSIKGEEKISDAFQAYAQSKLAITIWTQELAHSLKPKQVAVAVNPGSMLASKMVKEGFGVAGNALSIGADILVRAAISEEFASASGKYYDNDSKSFSAPHREALDKNKRVKVMETL
jgi:NAD(P)-dependent dehydrogenase (short-subunit alcohol dehydrogenase family)